MLKVLHGEGYTQARLSGIQHEGWAMRIGRIPFSLADKGEGSIITNSITGEVGLVCETESQYHCLPDVHENRLVDVVDGDGWMDAVSETEE